MNKIDHEPEDFLKASESKSSVEVFIEAWQNAQGDDLGSKLSREALEVIASESEEYKALLDYIQGSTQDSLELHLTESNKYPHSVSALHFGEFVSKFAKTLKEFTKSQTGIARVRDGLLISALQPGSVQLNFEVKPHDYQVDTLPGTDTLAIESKALRTLVGILVIAEDDSSELLQSAVQELSTSARRSLGAFSKALDKSPWSITGTHFPKGRKPEDFKISTLGVKKIIDATKVGDSEIETKTESGYVVGWLWRQNTMEFLIKGSKKAIRIYVPEELAQKAAELNARHEEVVRIKFEELRFYLEGDSSILRKSFTLKEFQKTVAQQGLDL